MNSSILEKTAVELAKNYLMLKNGMVKITKAFPRPNHYGLISRFMLLWIEEDFLTQAKYSDEK